MYLGSFSWVQSWEILRAEWSPVYIDNDGVSRQSADTERFLERSELSEAAGCVVRVLQELCGINGVGVLVKFKYAKTRPRSGSCALSEFRGLSHGFLLYPGC